MKIIFSLFLYLISFCFLFGQNDTSLVLITKLDSSIITDVRYSTTNNFTGKILYKSDKVYLRKRAADSLVMANKYFLKNYNLRIKIYDGYRPLSVQKFMWEIFPDDRYVANPAKGSRHNRGAAVDITLVDSLNNEVDMGTDYDDFTIKAHPDYDNLPREVILNRKLLRDVMKKFDFMPINSEWWHFDFKDWKNYSILDEEIN